MMLAGPQASAEVMTYLSGLEIETVAGAALEITVVDESGLEHALEALGLSVVDVAAQLEIDLTNEDHRFAFVFEALQRAVGLPTCAS